MKITWLEMISCLNAESSYSILRSGSQFMGVLKDPKANRTNIGEWVGDLPTGYYWNVGSPKIITHMENTIFNLQNLIDNGWYPVQIQRNIPKYFKERESTFPEVEYLVGSEKGNYDVFDKEGVLLYKVPTMEAQTLYLDYGVPLRDNKRWALEYVSGD